MSDERLVISENEPRRTRLCGIKDSNFHSSRNQILSLARLPIPPMPRERSERPF